ncbi:CshA/CshB family fibrillar adhesin-related protein [Pseudoxanthomonas sacheonensis]|uniref:CshA/CshB family fibrillar adhesin-related protein n=1 Tax=Pseudoxanthomonas sacheonensis TaxID=443615 RepID=UPI0013D67EE4|nr:CshA/CshB family fibrillar adhesin-related protein [Pseudoxanthomonas sacheonensis]
MRSQVKFWASKGALGIAFCALLAVASPAQAQFATGGSGLHRGRIFWVDWGNNGENVFAGKTITRGFNIGTPASSANRLDITCTLSNAARTRGTVNGLTVYTPGSWQGDGLDDLYNIGGNHPGQGANPNTLSVGLATPGSTTIEFDFSCSATLGGVPFGLSGLVFADAEASGGSEFVAARLTSGGTLRVIDEIAQCRGGNTNIRSTVTVSGNEVRFAGPTAPATSCEGNATPSLRAGPALVGFIDGALSARVIAQGGGVSAVAVGAVIDLEFSEAIPASYGSAAAHVLNTNWSGGVAVTGGDYNDRANLATVVPGARLGATIEPDPDAAGAVGGSDVDALPKTTGPLGSGYAAVPPPSGPSGASYTISNIACTGPAFVAGWIDFDGNGSFDADDRSATATCPSGSGTVSLTWTIPADYTTQATSYMRLRLSPDEASIANPAGVAVNGEAEDYRLALPQIAPTVTIAKISTGGVGTFSFSGDNGIAAQSLTTTAPNTAVSGAAQSLTAAGAPVTLTEDAATGFALTGIVCTGLGAGGTATPDLAARTVLLDAAATAADANITCTFTNSAIANLQITKTNTPASGSTDGGNDTVPAGSNVDYTIVATNLGPGAADGAVVRDTPLTGLTCATATCGSSNGATCPAETGSALATAMQSAAGIGIPTLPANGSVTFTLSCSVSP